MIVIYQAIHGDVLQSCLKIFDGVAGIGSEIAIKRTRYNNKYYLLFLIIYKYDDYYIFVIMNSETSCSMTLKVKGDDILMQTRTGIRSKMSNFMPYHFCLLRYRG